MPFWWRRRKRPWYWNRYKKYNTRRRRKRRRIYKRRRPTRYPRKRRKRRRYKVRKKRKTLPVRQWQPDSIRKCKIKSLGVLVMGAEGTQINCYTAEKHNYVPPKVPWGGGIGVEQITLNYLYEEHQYKNNIWTASNKYKDLCRYLGCTFIFYRHPETDFIVQWTTQPPYILDKYTYPARHPQMLLLDKHHKIILSQASKPNGKYKVKVKIKPPKQMLTKWFFTKDFAKYSLVTISAAAANFRYSHLSNTNQNMLVTIYSLNTGFWQDAAWSSVHQGTVGFYKPYPNVPSTLNYTKKDGKSGSITMNHSGTMEEKYYYSVNYNTGWFQSDFLLAQKITNAGQAATAIHPVTASRYNPNKDMGTGNLIYVVSTQQHSWTQPSDKQLYVKDLPLWLGLLGFISYLKQVKTYDYILTHVVVLKSDAIHCLPEIGSCGLYIPIDYIYLQGRKPYDQTITETQKRLWFPDITWQLQTLNAIVESGPFIPQYSNERNSTWELKYRSIFYFKWGGPQLTDKEVENPKDLDSYDVPDTFTNAIQIVNPEKQAPETIFYPWDIRRGVIKERALKRMYENLSTDTEFQCTPEKIKKKKDRVGAALQHPNKENEKIQSYLQTLCEENTCQNQENQDLQQLIMQQQQQQQKLKYSILKLLIHLKKKQRAIQYHTGLLE
nr:MAG: ORF1 [Torque teno midi virus]